VATKPISGVRRNRTGFDYAGLFGPADPVVKPNPLPNTNAHGMEPRPSLSFVEGAAFNGSSFEDMSLDCFLKCWTCQNGLLTVGLRAATTLMQLL
jgi:hypothetical protein